MRRFALAFALVAVALPSGSAAAPRVSSFLRLHPLNHHYFEFKNQPTILVTSGEHYGAVLNLDFDYLPYLNELQSKGLNNTRMWTGTYVEIPGAFGIQKNTLAPVSGRFICPWARSGTPGYAGGGNKFNLDAWDAAYFNRLKDFVGQASSRSITVEVNLFCIFYDDGLWGYSPMNAANNVNGVGALSKDQALTLGNGNLLARQEALVRKIVVELATYDNVYYEVCNEPYFGVPLDWQYHIAAVVADAESGFADKHLISLNAQNGTAGTQAPPATISILNWHYADPPDVVANYYGLNIVIGENETGFDGSSDYEYRKEGWHFIVAGGALYNNLDYSFTTALENGTDSNSAPGGGGPILRSQLKILKDFMDGFDFVSMAPNNGVIQGGLPGGATARALVQTGEQYAVYLSGGSQANLVLQLPAGSYQADWVNTKNGNVDGTATFIHGGGNRTLSSPGYSEDIALRVKRTGAAPPPPPPPPPPVGGGFYRAINLNGPALTIDGNAWEGSNAPNYSTGGSAFENQGVALTPSTDASRAQMIRSSVWNSAGSNVTMTAVPAGTYMVYLYVWEDNYAATYDVAVNGQTVQAGYSSGAGGHWDRLGPWTVAVSGGAIAVTCSPGDANLSGLEVWSVASGGGGGSVLREYWTGIGGTSVADLTGNAAYPRSPSGSSLESSFEAPTDWTENYGTRMRGYVTAPVSGLYTFWIASDDNGELWLSGSENPAGKTLIASVPEWTSPREWTKYPAQHSAPIALVAGQRYYLEALQKEGGGGDNLAVGWTLPDGTDERPIPGSRLAAVDPLDSDGDGVCDAAEIAAGTNPEDSSSGGNPGGGGAPVGSGPDPRHVQKKGHVCGLVGAEALGLLLLAALRRRRGQTRAACLSRGTNSPRVFVP